MTVFSLKVLISEIPWSLLTDGIHQAIVQLFVQHSGEICIEVKPHIKHANIVPVYFRTILADTAIAIDLKGALKIPSNSSLYD